MVLDLLFSRFIYNSITIKFASSPYLKLGLMISTFFSVFPGKFHDKLINVLKVDTDGRKKLVYLLK